MSMLTRMDMGVVELGSVGEWISGLGTLVAVAVAMKGTYDARKSAAEDRRLREEAEQRALEIAEARDQRSLELARLREVEEAAHRYATSVVIEVVPVDESGSRISHINVRSLNESAIHQLTVHIDTHHGRTTVTEFTVGTRGKLVALKDLPDDVTSDRMAVTVEFTDPDGLRWRRQPNGDLALLNRREITYEDAPDRDLPRLDRRPPRADSMIIFSGHAGS